MAGTISMYPLPSPLKRTDYLSDRRRTYFGYRFAEVICFGEGIIDSDVEMVGGDGTGDLDGSEHIGSSLSVLELQVRGCQVLTVGPHLRTASRPSRVLTCSRMMR